MPTPLRTLTIYPFLTVGVIVGALFAFLISHFSIPTLSGIFPLHGKGISPSYISFLYYWIGFYGLLFLLAYPNAQSLTKLVITTFVCSLLAGFPFYWSHYDSSSQFFLMLFSAYAINAFHIHYHSNHFQLSYQALFCAVWDTFVKLMMALFFTLLCWIILFSTATLFKLINIFFFSRLISTNWSNAWLTAILFNIGLYIPSKINSVVRNIRTVFLYICRYLFIPLAIIGIIFIAAFFIKNNQHLDTNTSTLLFIPFLCVIFLNGVYQDGLIEKPYPTFLMWICRLFLWVTPIFTLLALHNIYFSGYNNISEHGFNVHNFFYFLNTTLLLIYNLTYFVIALGWQKQWLKPIEHCNIVLAIIVIITAMITTQPWLIKLI